jgi:pimeloyl-ACP methyl ester carboxylesterase
MAAPRDSRAGSTQPDPLDMWTDLLAATGKLAGPQMVQDACAYWIDACQRSVLFWDVMRQRGNQHRESAARKAPHVLSFEFELVARGLDLPRPVNYALVRITPPAGVGIDPKRRPFVIVDPRAGHGPGIGGFKSDSEIGVAMKAGHPCYLIGFLPEPVPGQTIEDVMHAEAAFLERVIALHPKAEGKPAVIGNCQGGWAVMMLAAIRPELFGPILVAGAPLSYWAGASGQNPMRYAGGLLGGSWLAALMGDIGNGKFDGAWLVQNFESLNPANTLWSKQANLYGRIDTEAARYLGFEQWWSNPVLLNAEEIQFIVDRLFVGNQLATADIVTSDGTRIDLRNIRSPVIVFCSKGDNITPPPQALGWIVDLYESDDDIRTYGQTIVYAVHESVGHLGIFVSGGVAKKEHDEFATNIDLIDVLPPGLYEAVMTPRDADDPNAGLVGGDYLVRFEARTLDDVRAIVGRDEEDERRFAAVARLSEINLGLYRTFLQPWVRAFSNEATAEWSRRLHPLRLQSDLLTDANPFMRVVAAMAEAVRADRQPAAKDNPLGQAQEAMSRQIVSALETYGETRDRLGEQWFRAVYGSPWLQALLGLKATDEGPRNRPGQEPEHVAFVDRRKAELLEAIEDGGAREAAIRALIYIRLPEGAVDERGFNLLERMRGECGCDLTLSEFKQLVRDQFFMLLLDQGRAVAAIATLLAADRARAARMHKALHDVVAAVGLTTDIGRSRLEEIDRLFRSAGDGTASPSPRPRTRRHTPRSRGTVRPRVPAAPAPETTLE